MLDENPLFLTL